MGSSRAALIAGNIPNISPTAAAKPNDSPTAQHRESMPWSAATPGTREDSSDSFAAQQADQSAHQAKHQASTRNCSRIAPGARRRLFAGRSRASARRR